MVDRLGVDNRGMVHRGMMASKTYTQDQLDERRFYNWGTSKLWRGTGKGDRTKNKNTQGLKEDYLS